MVTETAAPPATLIREATVADLPELLGMGEQFVATIYAEMMPFNPAQIAHMLRQMFALPKAVIYVAETDGQVVGTIGGFIVPNFWSGEEVASEAFWWASKRGTGMTLFRAFEAWAKGHGVETLQMVAPSARVGQIYARLGFRKIEENWQRKGRF